jgi:poly(A)-specific ribonuclease
MESLPVLLETIREADFIAYDTEFSGLNIGFADKVHDYETLESRYQKLKHACTRLHAFQFGFCTFKWD